MVTARKVVQLTAVSWSVRLIVCPLKVGKFKPFKRGDYGWHGLIRVMPTIWGVLGLMFVAEILVFVALFFVAVL